MIANRHGVTALIERRLRPRDHVACAAPTDSSC